MADQHRGRGRGGNRGGRGRGRGAEPSAPGPSPAPQGPRQQNTGSMESQFPALAPAPAAPRSAASAPPTNAWTRNNVVASAGSSAPTVPAMSAPRTASGPSSSRPTAHGTITIETSMQSLNVNDPSVSTTTHGKGDASPSTSAGKKLPDPGKPPVGKTEKSDPPKKESTSEILVGDSSVVAIPRPQNGFGTRGRPIGLRVNHYLLRLAKKDQMIYCYSLTIAARCGNRDLPPPLKPAMKRQIMNEFRRLNPNSVLGTGHGGEFAFNKADEIFAGFLLTGVDDEQESEFHFDTALQALGDPRTYSCTVALKLVRGEKIDNYLQVFKTGDLKGRTAEDYIRPVDTVLRQAMLVTQRAVEVGRGLYVPSENFALKCGRIAISKLFASVRPSTAAHGLIALFLTSGTAFYKAQPLLQFMKDNNGNLNINPSVTLDRGYIDWLNESEVKGLKVEVQTRDPQTQRDYPKTYAIRRICYEDASAKFFSYEQKRISVLEYHQRVLGRRVEYPRLQVVEMMNDSLIPIEFCNVKKHQQLLDRVAQQVAEEMVEIYSIPAPDRMRHIQQNRVASIANDNPVMQSFSLEMAPTMLALQGRVLAPPQVTQGGLPIQVKDGSWKCDFEKVETAKALSRWVLIYVDCFPIRGLAANLRQTGQKMGIGVNPPLNGEDARIRRNDLKLAIEKLDARNLDLAVFVENREGRKSQLHDEIKRICESGSPGAKGLKTQYLSRKAADRPGNLANILRKINIKLGGVNFTFTRPAFLKNVKTLVIGADVTHPKGAGLRKRPSVAAVVANTDDAFLQYKAVLDPQVGEGGRLKELIMNFGDIMTKLFTEYGSVPPDRIYYYRDGVSEGQYKQVLAWEFPALVDAFHRKYKREPSITFIIVTKRHQTRLECQNPQDAKGRGNNIPAGTVADKDLSSNLTFDWYLASHQGIQGTTRPAHYIVMIDQNKSTADQLQELSHALAHGFQRTTRSVSLPTPVYYAHLAAERAKEILGASEYPELGSDNQAHVQAKLQEIRRTLSVSVDGMYWV